MNNSISKLSEYFKLGKTKNKSSIIVFLVCLSIATTLWFFNALSKNYSTTVSYPVKFTNPPANRFLAGKTPEKLDLQIDGQGFSLLRDKLFSFAPINLDIEDITKDMDSNSGVYKVTSRSLISIITNQLKDEIKISNINPEILTIVLDSLIIKTVPVELDINMEFEPRFNLKSPVSTTPDSVRITGPAILLNKISVLKTKVNIVNKLNASVRQEIELIHPDKTTILPEKVNLLIEVEEYTEKEIRIPIKILNKPEKVRITLFPSELKVVFNVGLSRFENIKPSDFSASIDCDSIVKDVNNLTINLYKKPDFIQNLRFVPEKVEFLIETN
jgi:YbbR domain-containing protein